MTGAFGSAAVQVAPRIYGASELGVLSLTAPGDAHPRVEYVGGEVFVGVDEGGKAVTQGRAEEMSQPFASLVGRSVAAVGSVPAPVEGVILLDDEVTAAAVLLDPSRIAGGAVDGERVLFALARDRVAIVGAEDEAAVARVLDLADQLYDAGGPLVSVHPVVPGERGWEPFPWRERIPSLELRFERALRLFSVRAYEGQSAALQRPDVHIADPKVHVREDGVTLTFAAWPKDTATLLPVVDNVMVADPAGTISVVTMAEFLDAAGDAVVRTGLSPVRYFVPGDPPTRPSAS